MSVERTLWIQPELNDPSDPSNQGGAFKPPYRWDRPEHERPPRVIAYPGDDANLVSSFTRQGNHAPVLDLDVPVKLVPSKTPGHSHLYIDVELSWDQYRNLLGVLAAAGIIEQNYKYASFNAGMSFVRLDPESRPERGLVLPPVSAGPHPRGCGPVMAAAQKQWAAVRWTESGTEVQVFDNDVDAKAAAWDLLETWDISSVRVVEAS